MPNCFRFKYDLMYCKSVILTYTINIVKKTTLIKRYKLNKRWDKWNQTLMLLMT